jgi:hypothetical protein
MNIQIDSLVRSFMNESKSGKCPLTYYIINYWPFAKEFSSSGQQKHKPLY